MGGIRIIYARPPKRHLKYETIPVLTSDQSTEKLDLIKGLPKTFHLAFNGVPTEPLSGVLRIDIHLHTLGGGEEWGST